METLLLSGVSLRGHRLKFLGDGEECVLAQFVDFILIYSKSVIVKSAADIDLFVSGPVSACSIVGGALIAEPAMESIDTSGMFGNHAAASGY
ncbi:unannotated protein [freshwater metagenome]|uniref:Unannotated protein n=1 Tax=freshwater metagenome TaxID=449393 RepID=A0A6J7KMM5_9ZZZZ|nr:hypothetical protein [Actinomycetota bacterium]